MFLSVLLFVPLLSFTVIHSFLCDLKCSLTLASHIDVYLVIKKAKVFFCVQSI